MPAETPAATAGAETGDLEPEEEAAQGPVVETARPGLGASAPPPPENSTFALVWKPGQIERLPPAKAKPREYEVIAISSLPNQVGKRVQLLTSGGKRVDGDVKSVDSANLVLLVQVGRGSAELNVPLANIREARLFRSDSPRSR
jgi:small nuclear ribonucleoprotein (snRNP)-like protein